MDASGFEVVKLFRQSGVPVITILMDIETFEANQRFRFHHRRPRQRAEFVRSRRFPWLTKPERALYECLTDPNWAGMRRVEQERIPLAVALAAVKCRVTSLGTGMTPVHSGGQDRDVKDPERGFEACRLFLVGGHRKGRRG